MILASLEAFCAAVAAVVLPGWFWAKCLLSWERLSREKRQDEGAEDLAARPYAFAIPKGAVRAGFASRYTAVDLAGASPPLLRLVVRMLANLTDHPGGLEDRAIHLLERLTPPASNQAAGHAAVRGPASPSRKARVDA